MVICGILGKNVLYGEIERIFVCFFLIEKNIFFIFFCNWFL